MNRVALPDMEAWTREARRGGLLLRLGSAILITGLLAAGGAGALGSLGCTVRTRRAPPPPMMMAYPQNAPPVAPAAARVGTLESDAPMADAEARSLFMGSLAQPPAPLVTTMVPSRVTALALDNTARGEANGMTADGSIQSALLMEGQRASTQVSIAPGGCATFIAHGGLGVVEVDLFLTVGSGATLRTLAEDPTTGPIAVIGGRGACFASAEPGPVVAELHARVRRGAGLVVVRGYRR